MAKKQFVHPPVELLTGNEKFKGCSNRTFKIRDFWRYMYSNIYENTGDIAEFLVAMALGKTESFKKYGWTQYDLDYEGLKIEVKATQYYQPWRADNNVSEMRKFGIGKALTIEGDRTSPRARNNDIYVFALNEGRIKDNANPLDLNNWSFWVIPTSIFNDSYDNRSTITLDNIKAISKNKGWSTQGVKFDKLKDKVDKMSYLVKH